MISVKVTRGAGDRQGAAVVDALITSEAGARERGNGEIDATGYDALLVATNGYLSDDHIEPGAVVECVDIERQAYRGYAERSAIVLEKSGTSFSATQALEIEVPEGA